MSFEGATDAKSRKGRHVPFWKRKVDPEEEAARAQAEAVLPGGWQIHRVDLETFSVPRGRVETYGICASGPPGENTLVIAVGKLNAYRQFVRYMNGDFEAAEGWAVPIPPLEGRARDSYFSVRHRDDPEVIAAKEEVDDALPTGWELFYSDRERYFFPGGYLETWAVSARGPAEEGELVMGLGEAGGLRQMARRLRGELETAEAWAPSMASFTLR